MDHKIIRIVCLLREYHPQSQSFFIRLRDKNKDPQLVFKLYISPKISSLFIKEFYILHIREQKFLKLILCNYIKADFDEIQINKNAQNRVHFYY